MIISFECPNTEALANGRRVRQFVNIERAAQHKLRQLQIVLSLDDLRIPPGNRLELLKGDRNGQDSIRINEQFRVCFRWTNAGTKVAEDALAETLASIQPWAEIAPTHPAT